MSQVDDDGYDTGLFREIVDVCKDPKVAIVLGENAFTYFNGIRKPIITTKGWEFLVKWKEGLQDW